MGYLDLNTGERTAVSSGFVLPKMTQFLWLVFIAYLVLPVIEIPLLGLSISAPLLFLVFLEIFLRPRRNRIKEYGRWLVIGYLFLLGLLLSLFGNASFIDTSDLITMIRYGYWIISFFVTIVIISSADQLKNVGLTVAVTILILAGLRLIEAVFWGRWGAWTLPQLMTQNSYGIQFSTFFPFALALLLHSRGRVRLIATVAVLLTSFAIAGNGSRSSWIAVGIGAVLFLVLYALTQRRGIPRVLLWGIGFSGIVIILITLIPSSIWQPVVNRFNTFNTLSDDKSFAIRELMIQKGVRLFEESPLFGAGIGRFQQASVPLDIPDVLSYAGQEHFDVKSAHNSYVEFLGETGLAGIIPFALLHLTLVFQGLPAVIKLARRGEIWALAVFASYVGMSIHLWSLAGLAGTAPWFVYGLVAGVIERSRRDTRGIVN